MLQKIVELIEKRQENSKTFKLDNGKRQLVVSIGAIHYKDNYVDTKEQWKDIDLTWEGNRIVKAPYELTLDGQKLTLKDKKTGEVSTIELLESNPAGLKWEILPEFSAVRFRHILPSDKVPFEAKFKVTGKISFLTRAFDDEGELELETNLADGILTERLSRVRNKQTGQVRPAKGNIRVDPTWQVGAALDDVMRGAGTLWDTGNWYLAGYANSVYSLLGSAARFTSVAIPEGATIDTAHLTLQAGVSNVHTTVNTRLRCEAADNPPIFSDKEDFDARTWTTEYVNWDGIGGWTINTDYDSPDIKNCVQEVIDRDGWASENALVVLWDDFEGRGTQDNDRDRSAKSYNQSTTYCPKLVITYHMALTRSASVIVGVVPSASRAVTIVRSSSVLIGILVAATKQRAASRASAILIGIVSIASRTLSVVRASSVIVGVVVTATRAITYIRASSTIVGIVAIASKLWNSAKISSVIVGNLVTASRSTATTRASSVQVGVLVNATKLWNSIKASLVIVGMVTTASRSITISRASFVIVGLLVIATRSITTSRASSVIVGIVVTAVRAVTVVRASSVIVGIVSTASRALGLARSASVLVGNLVSASRSLTIIRTSSVLVGIASTASRAISTVRASSVIVGVISTASRAISTTRSVATQIGIVATATRGLSYTRTTSVIVGIVVTASRIFGRIRLSAVSVGVLITSVYHTGRKLFINVVTSQYRKIRSITYGGQ